HVLARFLNVAADLGADLDDRLMHLRLDRLVQRQLGLGEDLRGNMRAQIAGLRIDRLVFLLNPDAQAWPVHLLIPLPLACLFSWVRRPSSEPSLSQPLRRRSRSRTHSTDTPE